MRALQFMLDFGPLVMLAEIITHIYLEQEGWWLVRAMYPVIVFVTVGTVKYALNKRKQQNIEGWLE